MDLNKLKIKDIMHLYTVLDAEIDLTMTRAGTKWKVKYDGRELRYDEDDDKSEIPATDLIDAIYLVDIEGYRNILKQKYDYLIEEMTALEEKIGDIPILLEIFSKNDETA